MEAMHPCSHLHTNTHTHTHTHTLSLSLSMSLSHSHTLSFLCPWTTFPTNDTLEELPRNALVVTQIQRVPSACIQAAVEAVHQKECMHAQHRGGCESLLGCWAGIHTQAGTPPRRSPSATDTGSLCQGWRVEKLKDVLHHIHVLGTQEGKQGKGWEDEKTFQCHAANKHQHPFAHTHTHTCKHTLFLSSTKA